MYRTICCIGEGARRRVGVRVWCPSVWGFFPEFLCRGSPLPSFILFKSLFLPVLLLINPTENDTLLSQITRCELPPRRQMI
jgi:hypothetical protein